MRILVTRGCGFIGSRLVSKLLALEHSVAVLGNPHRFTARSPSYRCLGSVRSLGPHGAAGGRSAGSGGDRVEGARSHVPSAKVIASLSIRRRSACNLNTERACFDALLTKKAEQYLWRIFPTSRT